MKLTIRRFSFLEKCTVGKLYIDDEDVSLYTLEPKVRDSKIMGQTAVPVGTYKVIVDYSNHFGRDLPHILNVPNFDGVRIHPGNTDLDTEGCILLGKTWSGGDFIGQSKEAFEEVFLRIKEASDCEIEIC
jgi:hypothetical protein